VKLTKTKLKQIIKEELKTLGVVIHENFMDSPDVELEDPESQSEYTAGDFVVVEISDDRHDKSIETITDPTDDRQWTPTHGFYTSEKFLAKIIQVSKSG